MLKFTAAEADADSMRMTEVGRGGGSCVGAAETLVLLDLDNTVMIPKQALATVQYFSDVRAEFMKNAGLSFAEAQLATHPMWKRLAPRCQVMPCEDSTVDCIHKLQESGCIVMGFTHRQPFVAVDTIRQVNSIGLCFAKSCAITNPSRADCLPILDMELSRQPARLQSGILFINDLNSKGEALTALLQHHTDSFAHIRRVVFVDDVLANVEDVMHNAVQWSTQSSQFAEFAGFFYRGSESIIAKVYDPHLGCLQWDHFQNTGIILSNEDTETLLKMKPLI
eukprot:ANDGO_01500.mRNA.1 hypothetical protein